MSLIESMSLHDMARAFITVFPAEFPDKSMIATIVLVARYRRPFWVWLGASVAFSIHVIVAVVAGSALRLLPELVVQVAVTTLFAVGALLLLVAARAGDRTGAGPTEVAQAKGPTSAPAAMAGSFGLIVLAEWGDLTQLATTSLVAGGGNPISVGLGAFVALAAVAGIAATVGRRLVQRFPLHVINYAGAAVFAGLALWTLGELIS